jgi:hypothetical protein
VSEWIKCSQALPKLTPAQRKPNQFGVQVLIWPPHKSPGSSDAHVAFYGTRVTDKPDFYLYGRCIDVTHWMPLPAQPVSGQEKGHE